MNNEERDMIAGLFDRLRETGLAEKDRDAERLIAQYVRQMPDAPYMLVQTVLIQEHALGEAEARIRDLEQRLAGQGPQAAAGSGSFLGGIRGGSRGAPSAGASVPSAGARRAPEPEPGYGRSPWGGAAQPPMPQAPQMPPMPQQSSGGGFGGFMRGALTTAAGVAGGMMIGDALKGMMGGSSNPFGGGHSSTSGSPLGGPGDKPHYQDASHNDPGQLADHTQEVQYEEEEQLDPDDWTVDDSTEV